MSVNVLGCFSRILGKTGARGADAMVERREGREKEQRGLEGKEEHVCKL